MNYGQRGAAGLLPLPWWGDSETRLLSRMANRVALYS